MTCWLSQAAEAEAKLDNARIQLELYEKVLKEIARLTVDHDIIVSLNGNEYASVSPRKLGESLAVVKADWYVLDKPL
jgi:hypothetical protein